MFVQVIQGRVDDPAEFRAAIDQWVREVSPGADGWLGSTGGVTPDGRLIAVVRFESAEAAQRNSDRPEQDAWWSQTSKLFDGEPTFQDSDDVTVDIVGDPSKAGFVQVMQGHGTDAARARELMSQHSADWAAFRPEILGRLAAGHDGGDYTVAIYFTSQADARAGEQKELPPKLQEQMAEMAAISVGETEFFDLENPWLHSPG